MPQIDDEKSMSLQMQLTKQFKEVISQTIKLRGDCGNLRKQLTGRNYYLCFEILMTLCESMDNNST